MQSLRFFADEAGDLTSEIMPLRMPRAAGVIDPEPFRVRALEVEPAITEHFALSGGVRTLHVVDGGVRPLLFDGVAAQLSFVISGQITVTLADATLTLKPGDLFYIDGGAAWESALQLLGDCRLLQIATPQEWPEARSRPPHLVATPERDGAPLNMKRMFKAADDQSYFRDFDTLFSTAGKWSETRPIIGFRFIDMAADTFIDWHPEIVNNLVVVLSGGLELETGGGAGAVEVFWPGDVCLAEDRTGQGHIDRMHGHVQVAVLIMDDDALWP